LLVWGIKQPIWEILRWRHQRATYQLGYFAKLGGCIPELDRLKVFSTNYDLCVEDACRSKAISVITGFDQKTGRWNPSRFREGARGVNLYKLHGSLNWSLNEDIQNQFIIEQYPPSWNKEPDLILGPGSKLQHDDPFVTLYSEFHAALREARTCISIGYGFNDSHIAEPVREASNGGMKLIDVNPSPMGYRTKHYMNIPMGARAAFESGEILKALHSVER